MITGFNTDVEHEGVVYHVQTEDKGLDSPLILSLVYTGGAILASKRSPYDDLIASGFDETTLAERLKRQHRLICAAILAGRLEELKTLGVHQPNGETELPSLEAGEKQIDEVPVAVAAQEVSPPVALNAAEDKTSRLPDVPAKLEAYSVHDSRRQFALEELSDSTEGWRVHLLDEQEFLGGQSLTLRIMVSYRSSGKDKPKSGVLVSVKFLGTMFRPQLYSAKTQRDGIATVSAQIPQFSSGRAAVLVRAVVGGETVEVRRVIHPGR